MRSVEHGSAFVQRLRRAAPWPRGRAWPDRREGAATLRHNSIYYLYGDHRTFPASDTSSPPNSSAREAKALVESNLAKVWSGGRK